MLVVWFQVCLLLFITACATEPSWLIKVNDDFCLTRSAKWSKGKQLSLQKCENLYDQQFHLQSQVNLNSNTQWYTIHDPSNTDCIDISYSNVDPILEMFQCGDNQPKNQLFSFKQQQMHSGMTTCISVTPANILIAGHCDVNFAKPNSVAKIDVVAAKFLKDYDAATTSTETDTITSIFSSRSFLFVVVFIVVCWGLREALKLSRASKVAGKKKLLEKLRKRR